MSCLVRVLSGGFWGIYSRVLVSCGSAPKLLPPVSADLWISRPLDLSTSRPLDFVIVCLCVCVCVWVCACVVSACLLACNCSQNFLALGCRPSSLHPGGLSPTCMLLCDSGSLPRALPPGPFSTPFNSVQSLENFALVSERLHFEAFVTEY